MSEKQSRANMEIEVRGGTEKNKNNKIDIINTDDSSSDDGNNDCSSVGSGTVFSPEEIRKKNRGKSDIETLARTIDDRRNNRMEVTFSDRKKFLAICLKISKKEGRSLSRFSKEGLERLVHELKERIAKPRPSASRFNDKRMLRLFEAGLEYTENSEEDEFYFRDFNFYCMTVVSGYSFMRISPGFVVLFWLLSFYFGSAVLFCAIMKNDNICPRTEDDSYGGWMTSIYFASATMSTVGYGDVSLYEEGQKDWITFIGIIYMLISVAIAFTVFSAAASLAIGGIFKFNCFTSLKTKIMESEEIPLYKQCRRLVTLRIVELTIYFLGLNATGIFVARFFVNRTDIEGQQWNWMTTIYWAIQTTTTIGYGDPDMPFHLRWFNIFFTTFGTAFVGTVFGSLAGLQDEINDHRRYYAWKRREMSKMMVDELQVNDDKLDQYEFVLGSLLLLQKVKTEDITQIMEKFHELAGDKNYICVSDENLVLKEGDNDVNTAVPLKEGETNNNDRGEGSGSTSNNSDDVIDLDFDKILRSERWFGGTN